MAIMETSERFLQILAFSLVALGLCACGVGDHWGLSTLANGGTTAIGLGGGLLTSKMLNQTSSGKGSIINNPIEQPKEGV